MGELLLLKKTAFILTCAIFMNCLSAWAFFGNDFESGILEQAISVQSPIIEFMTATTLPIKIVGELFSSYNTASAGQKSESNKKSKKENKNPSDLSLNILSKTLDKSSRSCKDMSCFWKKISSKITLFVTSLNNGPGRSPNDPQCGLLLLYILAYFVVLSRKSLPNSRLNIIHKSNKTRYLLSRVFSLSETWE